MKIIGFTGLKGSGKDTAASVFIRHGYEHVKMAGALKAMLREFLVYQGVSEEDIQRRIEGDLKEAPCEALNGTSMRRAMVLLGTEWGRDLIHPDLWVDVARRRCQLFDKVAISDIRFPNEVKMVQDLGGRVVRIERPGLTPDSHPSELLISELAVDDVLVNDFRTAHSFKSLVERLWFET